MTEQIAENILDSLYRVVVPLPRNPLKEVNCYVLAEDDRWLVIDTGMNRPECREVLTAGLDDIGVDLAKTDFLATHLHADHHGLIPELLQPGRTASMGAIDAAAMGRAHGGWSENSPMGVYLRRSGFPPEELAESFRRHPGARFSGSRRIEYAPLHEGDVVEIAGYSLEVIDTPGHTFGHISLYDRAKRLFIAGDHILGDITPNIQAWADDHDPLGLYLESVAKVEALDVDLCLPGHRSLIHDFKGRCAELRRHHEVRGQEVIDILRANGSRNAYQTASEMTWDIRAKSWEDFPIMQRWFATGEAIAHLRWLEDLGELRREDAGERILYSASRPTTDSFGIPESTDPTPKRSTNSSDVLDGNNPSREQSRTPSTNRPDKSGELRQPLPDFDQLRLLTGPTPQLNHLADALRPFDHLRPQLAQMYEDLQPQLHRFAEALQPIDRLRSEIDLVGAQIRPQLSRFAESLRPFDELRSQIDVIDAGIRPQLDRFSRALQPLDELRLQMDRIGESLRPQLDLFAETLQPLGDLHEQLRQTAKPLADLATRLADPLHEKLGNLFESVLPTASQISSLSSVLAHEISPYPPSIHIHAQWEASLAARMNRLEAPWVLADRPHLSLAGFARLSRISDAVRGEDPYSEPVADLLAEELHQEAEFDQAASVDERDSVAVEAGLNHELIAFPESTYGSIVLAAGFTFEFGTTQAPSPLDSVDCGAAYDPTHSQVMTELEQRLRSFVEETLCKAAGPRWVKRRVPEDVRTRWEERQEEDRDAHRPVYPVIQYADFMDLADVIGRNDNWPLFEPVLQNRDDFVVSLRRLHPVRKAIAHSRPLARADVITLVSEASRILGALGVPFLASAGLRRS